MKNEGIDASDRELLEYISMNGTTYVANRLSRRDSPQGGIALHSIGDEAIISARLAAQAKLNHTIEKAVTIEGAQHEFSRREFALGFSMVVPDGFNALDQAYTRRKVGGRTRAMQR